jgi:hypothetical protein
MDLRRARRALYPAVSRVVARATLVEGVQKGSDERFTCLFVDNSSFCDEVVGRVFLAPPRVVEKRRLLIASLTRLIAAPPARFDLCMALLPRIYDGLFRGACDYKASEYVRQVIDTSGTWDDIRSAFGAKKRQVSNDFEEKSGLGYRISRDPADFDHFYHRMFVPHVTRRYGALATIDAYAEMRTHFRRGLLVFVTRNGTPVAGALSLVEDGLLRFRRTGVLNGEESLVESGAQTALYYFQLKYAALNGLKAVDTMLSRPFLNDGVFRHKKEWGAEVLPDDGSSTWLYLFNARPSAKIARFFAHNPMVVHGRDGLEGIVGAPMESSGSRPSFDALVRRYQAKGLVGYRIVTSTEVITYR